MIIGIAGPAGAGKDTLADYLVQHYGFTKISWAGPLKAGLAAMGFPEPVFRQQKEVVIPGFGFSWRQAAQTLGTEWGRALDPDIWVKLVGEQMLAAPERNWVVSDTRFENEASMIRGLGGVMVHLDDRKAALGDAAAHSSESGLRSRYYNSDWIISNGGSLEDLYNAARQLLYVHGGSK